jgi:hypothetical protein
MLRCISHNGYYGTCFPVMLHRNRVNRLRRKQLISLTFCNLLERLEMQDVRLCDVNLHRCFGLAQVTVEYFAHGAERNGLIVALDETAEPRDGALGQTVQLALEDDQATICGALRVQRA